MDKRVEKHNVLHIIKEENLNDFTVEKMCYVIRNKYYGVYWCYESLISDILFELVKDDEISVLYVSKRCLSGYRTEGIYDGFIKQRNKKISEILE